MRHSYTCNETAFVPPSVSGTVAELSPLAGSQSGLKKGDRVMALVGGGGYAGELASCTRPCLLLKHLFGDDLEPSEVYFFPHRIL